MPLSLAVLSLLAGLLATDTFPLREVHVHGNKELTEARILAVTGLQPGQTVGKTELDAAKDKILSTGMFETVAFQFEPDSDGQCCLANYDVVEIDARFPIQFEGIPEPAAAIEKFLSDNTPLFQPKLPGTPEVIAYYARQIERYLAYRNRAGSVVGTLVPTGGNEWKITFRMNTSLPAISNVVFTGSKAIAAVALQKAINDAAFGQPFTRDGFRLLLESHVKPLYDAIGIIRVKFPGFITEPDTLVKGVIVHVTVEESATYRLSAVTISGAGREYLETANIKPGNTVNFDEVNTGMERVKAQLKKEGYMHVDGDIDRKIDDEAKTVSVNLTIEKGGQYTMGKLTIIGLDLKGEPAVRKLWGIPMGKPFNAAYPQYFLDRIRENGYFDNLGDTKPTTQIDEKTRIVDVTLTFSPSKKNDARLPTGTISIPHR